MHYPQIDPVIVSLGPLAIRWYGLAYLAGFAVCWWLGGWRARHTMTGWSAQDVSDLVFYGALGAVLGGRIGYCLFYQTATLLADPLFLFRIWEGGMSFHGGMLGVAAALLWFGRKRGRRFLEVGDFVAPLVPIGLGFGRLGNFANTELPGRISESGFGLIYPCSAVQHINLSCLGQWENVVRHPSSLYQAACEGVVLFILVWLVALRPRPTGLVSGVFLVGYGTLRCLSELFREPDADLGFIVFDSVTMGQILSLPMAIVGILLILWSGRRGAEPASRTPAGRPPRAAPDDP